MSMWILFAIGGWMVYFSALGLYVSEVKHRHAAEAVFLAWTMGPLGLILVALFPQGERMRPFTASSAEFARTGRSDPAPS